jgi:hypothetical protein
MQINPPNNQTEFCGIALSMEKTATTGSTAKQYYYFLGRKPRS